MNTDSLNDAINRTLAALKEGRPEMVEEIQTSDTTRYTDPVRFDRETDVLFRRLPTYLGHVSQLPEAGSYLRRELVGTSVLLVRGEDNTIRAFVNACRHRGTQLVDEFKGCQKRFVCPYHAWSYNNDGSLAMVPQDFGFPDLNRDEHGLVQLPLWQRNGLLWTLADGNSDFDFETFWQPIEDEISLLGLEDAIVYRPGERDWQVNWKIIIEGGMESYHFKKAHMDSIAPYFYSNQSVYDALGPHSRLLFPRSNFLELENKPEAERSLAGYANIVYAIPPTTVMLVQADHTALITLTPAAVDKTRISIEMLISRALFEEKDEAHWELNCQITNDTLDEDFTIGEKIQRGIGGGHLKHLTFGRYEHGLASVNRTIDSLLSPQSSGKN